LPRSKQQETSVLKIAGKEGQEGQKERSIDYVESGTGPAVLFLPGSYSTTAAWRQVQRHLSPGYRLVAASLSGYGGTTDTRTRQDCGIGHEVQLVQEAGPPHRPARPSGRPLLWRHSGAGRSPVAHR
jgi:hypothetical protein